jgi:hypothetical protein
MICEDCCMYKQPTEDWPDCILCRWDGSKEVYVRLSDCQTSASGLAASKPSYLTAFSLFGRDRPALAAELSAGAADWDSPLAPARSAHTGGCSSSAYRVG